jgi:hypothetical protein
LIEYVDINLPKLFLNTEPHSATITCPSRGSPGEAWSP